MKEKPDRRGSKNPNSKLTLEKVRYILASSKSCSALARELGVSRPAVSNVRSGRTWFWIDENWDEEDGLEYEEAA